MSDSISDEEAEVARSRKTAICREDGCDRSWEGSAVKEVGAAHSARYDHRVEVIKTVVFDGPVEDDD